MVLFCLVYIKFFAIIKSMFFLMFHEFVDAMNFTYVQEVEILTNMIKNERYDRRFQAMVWVDKCTWCNQWHPHCNFYT
jgi:hypothetical protein